MRCVWRATGTIRGDRVVQVSAREPWITTELMRGLRVHGGWPTGGRITVWRS